MKVDRVSLGKQGEEKAAKFLVKKGYGIVERNFRSKLGEIDIIAENEGILVFVEVKTRTSVQFGFPCEAVDFNKRKKIIQIATLYLVNNRLNDRICRFDVIELLIKGNDTTINHIENAFTQ